MVEHKFLFPNQEAPLKMFQRPFGQPIPMELCSLLSKPRHQHCFSSWKCHLPHWLIAILSATVTTLDRPCSLAKALSLGKRKLNDISNAICPIFLSSFLSHLMDHHTVSRPLTCCSVYLQDFPSWVIHPEPLNPIEEYRMRRGKTNLPLWETSNSLHWVTSPTMNKGFLVLPLL